MAATISLPIDRLVRRSDARVIDPASVAGLLQSIAEIGLLHPLRVRPAGDKWEVVAGSHRLAACAELGLSEVECIIGNEDDLRAELAMIDENLCRADLSSAERAKQTARRKAIYVELHPETKHGANSPKESRQVGDSPSFAENTSQATGVSRRSVERDAERGEKVIDEAIGLIRGTKLDTGTYLDKLKKLSPNEQVAAVKRDLAQPREPKKRTKPPKVAADPLDDVSAAERQVARLMDAWNAAGPEAREEFLLRIDTPVFDRSAA